MANKNSNSLLNQRLSKLDNQKEDIKSSSVVNNIISGKEDEDLKAIAQELKERKEKEPDSINDPNLYVKDTIYIEKDVYEAFNALCLKRGDKKQFTNEALKDYVKKKYKELRKN